MASLTSIREALAASLSVIDGVQANAYLLSNTTPPAFEIEPGETEYDMAMARGLDRWTLTVRALVSATMDAGSQRFLDKLIEASGTLSVKAALEADSTLGGAVADVSVKTCSGYRSFAREGSGSLLGAEWTVEILATG